MRAKLSIFTSMIAVAASSCSAVVVGQSSSSWLDESQPPAWNEPGAELPSAPEVEALLPACNSQARPPESDADRRLLERGWRLVGAYQGGWQVRVIRATAGYDGMCRPFAYQDFVFVREQFAGTLAPQPMDSRSDGALGRVLLQSERQLVAEYQRYAEDDPLCCPSGTTSVTFEIAPDGRSLRAVSTSTLPNAR